MNTNTQYRYFYTDPLAAAWMEKHFGMNLYCRHDDNEMAEYELPESQREHPFGHAMIDDGCTAETWGTVIHESLCRRAYIHPDSLHLLAPQLGDIITVNDPAIDYHGYCFRPDILYRTYADGSYGTDEFACTKSADVRVIQRHCGDLVAFHWPEREEV